MIIQVQNVQKSGYLGILTGLTLGNLMSSLVGNYVLDIQNLRTFNIFFVFIFSVFVFYLYRFIHLKVYKKMKSVLPEIPFDAKLRLTVKHFLEIVVLGK